jgi:hypothetical protein
MENYFFLYFNTAILFVSGFIMMTMEQLRSLYLVILTSGQTHKELSKSVGVYFFLLCYLGFGVDSLSKGRFSSTPC